MSMIISALESGLFPDWIIRWGIRFNLYDRLRSERGPTCQEECEALMRFRDTCSRSAVAVVPEKANEQHYEVPSDLFGLFLGTHRKYSSCYYPEPGTSLDEAEAHMLRLTSERAQLRDGQRILELGCGWGSLTLWMAAAFPRARITGVSNSHSQREYILGQAQVRGLNNIEIITTDMNEFHPEGKFDRIVSVEMFEHMRNHARLFELLRPALRDDGKLFIHIFCHRLYAYLYESEGAVGNWMGRNFFSGGMMPSDNLLLLYPQHFMIEQQWRVSGTHYGRTSRHWLENLYRRKNEALALLATAYGQNHAVRHLNRWRVFFLACEELFNFRQGREWYVSHYLFSPRTGV